MKSTGIVRKVDQLGRVVLPMELRKTLDIKENDSIEIYVDEQNIILRKYAPGCFICSEANELQDFKGKSICIGCIKEISKVL